MLASFRRIIRPAYRQLGSTAWIVLIAGLALTAVAWRAAQARDEGRGRSIFDRWVQETRASIADRMGAYEQVLRGASGLLVASDHASRSEWREYVSSLKLEQHYPGIERLGFAFRVVERDLDTHVRATRAAGLPAYTVTPAGQRAEYFPILFVHPESRSGISSLGYDDDSDPRRRAAMDQARDSGEAMLTGRVALTPTARRSANGVVMYYPVYSSRMPHGTVDERRQALVGFVEGVFRIRHLMAGVLTNRPPGIDLDIYDGPVAPETLLYDDNVPGGSAQGALFSVRVSLEVAGRPWTLELSTQPAFNASIDGTPERLTLAGGVTISMLLFVGIGVSERRRHRQMDEDKQKLAALVENSTDYVGMATLDGTSIYLNPAGRKLIGVECDEDVIGQPFTRLIHEDERQRLADSLSEVRATGSWTGAIAFRHLKTGEPITCEITVFTVKWPDTGEPICLACVARDTRERKRAERELGESDARFRQLAEGINEAFWLFGLDGDDFLYISPAFETIWGRTPASLYAAPGDWLDAIHPDDRPRFGPASIESRAHGPSDEEYRIVRPDGEVRFIRERAFPIRDGSGRVYRIAAIAEDITHRRRLEGQLRQAQKMEAIGTLAGGIAHDFNNILAAIVGYTQLATMDADGNQRVLSSLTAVQAASRRATDLVRQILAFSRKEEPQLQQIQLEPVVHDALKLLRASLPSSIELRTNFAADTPAVMANATQIHQVIMNLGTNAWHSMKDGVGVLDVTLAPFSVDIDFTRKYVELKPGLHARLSIRDTGCGMDRATQERIFDPFFTTKAPGQGTGLGLSTVHGILKNHHGAISVYSQPGQGATFHLYFPASEEAVAARVEATAVPRGDGQRILFVDDEAPLAQWGEQALQRLGYSVTACTHAMDALAALTDHPDGFDLVVTDFTMPTINGISLAQQMRAVRPSLPLILATGNQGTMTIESLLEYGIRELLMKPVTLQALGEAVHRVLAQTGHANLYDSHLVGG